MNFKNIKINSDNVNQRLDNFIFKNLIISSEDNIYKHIRLKNILSIS